MALLLWGMCCWGRQKLKSNTTMEVFIAVSTSGISARAHVVLDQHWFPTRNLCLIVSHNQHANSAARRGQAHASTGFLPSTKHSWCYTYFIRSPSRRASTSTMSSVLFTAPWWIMIRLGNIILSVPCYSLANAKRSHEDELKQFRDDKFCPLLENSGGRRQVMIDSIRAGFIVRVTTVRWRL